MMLLYIQHLADNPSNSQLSSLRLSFCCFHQIGLKRSSTKTAVSFSSEKTKQFLKLPGYDCIVAKTPKVSNPALSLKKGKSMIFNKRKLLRHFIYCANLFVDFKSILNNTFIMKIKLSITFRIRPLFFQEHTTATCH